MKKILAVLMIVSVVIAFAACSSKEYVDVAVTSPVTKESGEVVTDSEGKAVTEFVTDNAGKVLTSSVDKESTKKGDIQITLTKDENSKSDDKTSKSNNTTEKSKNNSSKNNSNKNDLNNTTKKNNNTTSKKTTEKNAEKTTESTAASTTQKPKRINRSVVVRLPYYNAITTRMAVSYIVEGDKEYTELEPQEVTLDKAQEITVELGRHKGEVKVKVSLKGIDISNNTTTLSPYEELGKIVVVTGIEAMDGEDD